MSDKIKIDKVTGGKDKDMLKGCYFLPGTATGEYNFFDTNNNSLASGLTSGSPFSFTLDGFSWTVTDFAINDSAASGDWTNDDSSAPAAADMTQQYLVAEEGTFQAQAGGGGKMYSASAY